MRKQMFGKSKLRNWSRISAINQTRNRLMTRKKDWKRFVRQLNMMLWSKSWKQLILRLRRKSMSLRPIWIVCNPVWSSLRLLIRVWQRITRTCRISSISIWSRLTLSFRIEKKRLKSWTRGSLLYKVSTMSKTKSLQPVKRKMKMPWRHLKMKKTKKSE